MEIERLSKYLRDKLYEISNLIGSPPKDITYDIFSQFIVDKLSLREFNLTKSSLFPPNEEEVVQMSVKVFKEKGLSLSLNELAKLIGVKAKVIRGQVGSIGNLYKKCLTLDTTLSELAITEFNFEVEDYRGSLLKDISQHSKFVVTSAVSGKPVHADFFKILQNYAKVNNALILILPGEDRTCRRSITQWQLDPILRDCKIIFEDTRLNSNVFVSDIKVSAKQPLPLTGLSGLAQGKGSIVVGSPKQFLEFVPTGNHKLPLAIMSTGAVTIRDYSTDKFMSKRLSKLAEHTHILGAVVVELLDDKRYAFRQLQYCEKDNNVIDLDTSYCPDGTTTKVRAKAIVLGDSHVAVRDEIVHEEVHGLVDFLRPSEVLMHDVFDGECVSHHIATKPVLRALIKNSQSPTLEQEGILIRDYIDAFCDKVDKVTIVRSNHDDFLDRYLSEGRFINDLDNCEYSLDLCKAYLQGKNPLQTMVEDKIGLRNKNKVNWLSWDEDYLVKSWQCGNHGHLGANGSKGSVKNIEKCYPKSIIGHSHSPCIYRNVVQVGTLSKMKLTYNRGASAWVHSVAVIYDNGKVSLINFIPNKNNTCVDWRL